MRHDKPDPPESEVQPGLTELESLVRGVPLAPPSRQLDARIWRLLENARPKLWRGTALTGLAAAIVLAVLWSGWLYRPHRAAVPQAGETLPIKPTPVDSVSRPLRIERDASMLADRGIVGFAGKVPLHGYRVQSVRQVWYVDSSGKRLCVTVPSERLVLVPVHTF
jgi:hypothetical protein